MDEISIRAVVSGINLFTPCPNEETFEELEYLVTTIIKKSEEHFSPAQVKKIILALQLSAEWHEGDYRTKEGKEDERPPYIIHPFRGVVSLMARGVYDLKLLLAHPLHDTFEDAETKEERYRYRKIVRHLLRSTVLGVINLMSKGTRLWEKEVFFERLISEKRIEIAWRAQLGKLIDCFDNAQSFDAFGPIKMREKIDEVLREYPPVAKALEKNLRKLVKKGKLPAEPYWNLAGNLMQEITDMLYLHLQKRP